MTYLNPKFIVVDFLRNRLTDPRSTRAATSKSETFTATAGQTSFSLTPTTSKKLSHISSITVDGTSKKKWQDYYIDFRDEKVVFFSAMAGSESVIINYYESSSNWIYWDKPDEKLSDTSFPRISVMVVAGSGERLGEYGAPVESIIQFQVDVWAKEKATNQIFQIDSKYYTGNDLAEYLAYQVMQALEDHEDDFFPALYNYAPTQMPPRDLPFDEQYQCFHKEMDFILRGVTAGRVS